MYKIIILITLTYFNLYAKASSQDTQLRSNGFTYFGSVKAKIIKFGGFNTPECKLAIGVDTNLFYLTKINSTCWKGTNSNGVEIICNSNKSVCKTRKELIEFAQSDTKQIDAFSRPSWCRSEHLNTTERTICTNENLSKLDFDLAKVYHSSKAKSHDLNQKDWLKRRNDCKDNVNCLQNMYQTRIKQLQNLETDLSNTTAQSEQNKQTITKEEALAQIGKLDYIKVPEYLKKLPTSLKKDQEVVLEAVKQYGYALEYADDSLKKDKDFVLAAVKKNGRVLIYADDSFKKDKDFVLAAVKENTAALEYADDSFKKDKDVVLAAVKQNGYALYYAADSLKKDKEFMFVAINLDRLFRVALQYADDSLKKDKEVVLAAVKQKGFALNYADDSFKKDKDVVLAAVKQDGSALEYADDSLKKDKEVVLAAVKQYGRALKYADDSLKKDKEVVSAAIKQDGSALEYADDSLKEDANLMFKAIINFNN
jgi:hypothetical protein